MELVRSAAKASIDFEKNNLELKRQYIVSNIILYNSIASLIKESLGTFGTGYPFYVLNKDLTGALPVIEEQIRYGNELMEYADKSAYEQWRCARCLMGQNCLMPDLKQICNACPKIEATLKPRKIINRLPDLDLWMVCEDKDIRKVSQALSKKLDQVGLKTSDVDPIKTISEFEEIVRSLQNNQMPKQNLPIDTHIIDNITLYTLISEIPDVLEYCFRHDETPYLPIHPLSLRKTWQKDDCAYNFVHDYLSSFTEFNMDEKIQSLLDETRREVARKYSLDTLYTFLLKTGNEVVERRHKTPELKATFEGRIDSWLEK